jgi:hypothetical protein
VAAGRWRWWRTRRWLPEVVAHAAVVAYYSGVLLVDDGRWSLAGNEWIRVFRIMRDEKDKKRESVCAMSLIQISLFNQSERITQVSTDCVLSLYGGSDLIGWLRMSLDVSL